MIGQPVDHWTPLLLPGMACDARVWEPVAHRLARARVPVLVRGPGVGDTVTDLTRALLDDPDLPARFTPVGFSFGGHLALDLARRAPDRVSALGLLACGARALPDAERARMRGLAARIDAGGHAAEFGAGDGLVARMAREMAPATLAGQYRAQAGRPDSAALLRSWTGPLLLAVGDHDRACPPDAALALETAGPAQRHRVAGAGHYLPLDAPDAVADLLARWLGTARADAA